MIKRKKGVLLVNLGTPDAPEKSAVRRYLKQFLLDPRVIDYPWLGRNLLVRGIILPFRTGSSTKLYRQLWTEEGSPLKYYGEKVAAGVQKILGEDYSVELGMRYQNPSLKSAIDKLMKLGVDEITVFPMFPQYASATVGSVHEEVMRIISSKETIPELHLISSYYDYEAMIDVFVENSEKFDMAQYDHVLFSYHGLPQRQLMKADAGSHCLQNADCCKEITEKNRFCYSAQCHATTAALVKNLGLKDAEYTTSFQSRLGREIWAKPYTSDVIHERAKEGDKKILVFCPACVAVCLETTIEISVEYREQFLALGGERLDLVESLNENPHWMEAIAGIVKSAE